MSKIIGNIVGVPGQNKSELKSLPYYSDIELIPTDASLFEFDANTGELTKYKGSEDEIVIPYEINGVKVEYICESAFTDKDFLSTIIIPNSVYVIDAKAFKGCKYIYKLVLSNNLEWIDKNAFEGCHSLTNVVLPDKLREIYDEAFKDCLSLERILIPDSVTTIGSDAFKGCRKLSIYCSQGSYADTYATENGIDVVYTDVRKDCLIGADEYGNFEIGNNISGSKGFKIIAVSKANSDGTGTYTLRTVEGLEVGMEYSVQLSGSKIKAGKIISIDETNNTVTVDGYKYLELHNSADLDDFIYNYMIITGHPELGDVQVAYYCFVSGDNNSIQGSCGNATGYGNVVLARYGSAKGEGNVAGYCADASGQETLALGNHSTTEGYLTEATGDRAYAGGRGAKAKGLVSFARGQDVTASGDFSTALGGYTQAGGNYSTALGQGSEAPGENAIAMGGLTKASGECATATGSRAHAKGKNSFAMGRNTYAGSANQFVSGVANLIDTSNKYVHIVGNGLENASSRSNAYTLDWNGNAWFAGDITIGANEDKVDVETKIETLSDITHTFEFLNTHNTEKRLSKVTSISFVMEDGEYVENYTSGLSFDSGETATSIDYVGGILNWVGTDCASVDGLSIFQPSPNTHYDIVFYFNGAQFIGLVNGFIPATGNEAV